MTCTVVKRFRDALRARRLKIAVFGVLSLVVAAVYCPALDQLDYAYGDQPYFMVNTRGHHGFFSLVKASYSYSRARTEGPGDTLCFRPVMMTFMVLEKWAFGETNTFAWKLTGIILHLIVVWKLLTLLLVIRPAAATYAAASFFATMTAGMRMVYYSHINGYMLSLIFVLSATYHLCYYAREGQTKF